MQNVTANFGRNIPTETSGPPPEVIPNIPLRGNRNGPFHFSSGLNFRNLFGIGVMHLSMVCPKTGGGDVGQLRGTRIRKVHVGWDFNIHNDSQGGKFDMIAILKS